MKLGSALLIIRTASALLFATGCASATSVAPRLETPVFEIPLPQATERRHGVGFFDAEQPIPPVREHHKGLRGMTMHNREQVSRDRAIGEDVSRQ
jgi:hypothetical protein